MCSNWLIFGVSSQKQRRLTRHLGDLRKLRSETIFWNFANDFQKPNLRPSLKWFCSFTQLYWILMESPFLIFSDSMLSWDCSHLCSTPFFMSFPPPNHRPSLGFDSGLCLSSLFLSPLNISSPSISMGISPSLDALNDNDLQDCWVGIMFLLSGPRISQPFNIGLDKEFSVVCSMWILKFLLLLIPPQNLCLPEGMEMNPKHSE